jgi:hypothetical protein
VFLGATYRYPYRTRVALNLFVFLPTLLIAAFRGQVGTDTLMYRTNYVYSPIGSLSEISIDPAFYFFEWFFQSFGADFQYFLAFQALFCYVLFCFAQPKVDHKLPIFGLTILPVLFVDATFNGLRYGMSFAVLAFVYSRIRKEGPLRKAIVSVLPMLFHSSAGLFALRSRLLLLLAVPVVLLGAQHLQSLYVADYLSNKASEYSDLSRGAWYSGLFPVMQFSVLMWVRRACGAKRSELHVISVIIFLFAIALGFITMASLRFLQIAIFFQVIATAKDVQHEGQRMVQGILAVLGLLSIANFLRQVFLVGPAGDVLFYPYIFSDLLG